MFLVSIRCLKRSSHFYFLKFSPFSFTSWPPQLHQQQPRTSLESGGFLGGEGMGREGGSRTLNNRTCCSHHQSPLQNHDGGLYPQYVSLHMGLPGLWEVKRWLRFWLLYSIRSHAYWALRSEPGPLLCTLCVLISRILTMTPRVVYYHTFFTEMRGLNTERLSKFPKITQPTSDSIGFWTHAPCF